MMRMLRTRVMVLAAVALLASPVDAQILPSADPEPIFMTVGSGAVNGVYYPVGGLLCRLINRDRASHAVRCAVESTPGSLYNLAILQAGEVNFAIVQSDLLKLAYEGKGAFAGKPAFRSLRTVFSLHVEPITVVATARSGIRSLSDLPGWRVAMGPPGSGHRGTFSMIMDALGWGESSFSATPERQASEQPQALCEDEADAIMQVVGHPNSGIAEVMNHCQGRLVPIEGLAARALLGTGLGYVPVTISAGIYRNQAHPVASVGMVAVLVSTEQTDPALVRQVVRSALDNPADFIGQHPALTELTPQIMANRALVTPLHEGARVYYAERGWLQ